MAKRKGTKGSAPVKDHVHTAATRKNIPPAKIASEGEIPKVKKSKYGYSAHLSPELRFDTSGQSDRVQEIVEKAIAGHKLNDEEAEILRGVSGNVAQPWLEWSGKKEEHDRRWLEVDPVALHIHERVSAKAIVRTAKRKDVQRELFADPEQEYAEAVQFYKHDVDWANRLILGDSLDVMSSLSRREDLAGKVQMIYMDPPYGIKFASNFQSEVGRRDVKDKESDLTREPEMVKAYRDTWHLGVHSYLSYLRDRLIVARDLLTESGSIFVQISGQNIHNLRVLLDETFGAENYVETICYRTKNMTLGGKLLEGVFDYIVWYARQKSEIRYNRLFSPTKTEADSHWNRILSLNGEKQTISAEQVKNHSLLPSDVELYQLSAMYPAGAFATGIYNFEAFGNVYSPPQGRSWKTPVHGMRRLLQAERLEPYSSGSTLRYVLKLADYPVSPIVNIWANTAPASGKKYVVQTSAAVVERCMLMATNPGDLVLDPTCGSGTTAYVAEQWGRRWITIDSSRVALSIARQRLLTSKFDRYRVKGEGQDGSAESSAGIDPSASFFYKTIPHVTLKQIAQSQYLDPIFEKHEPILNEALKALNQTLTKVDDSLRESLARKLADKMQADGVRAATDSDRGRWLLPGTTKAQIENAFAGKSKLKANHVKAAVEAVPPDGKFEHWHVPFDTDGDWPKSLSEAVTAYREAWRAKMDEVNECIAANAEQETLVDQPEVINGVVRVSGPFSVEGVRPEELSLDEHSKVFDPTPNEWDDDATGDASQSASAYLHRMVQLLSKDGVTFPNNEHRNFLRIDALDDVGSAIHAEAIWEDGNQDEACNVAIAFGPQYGPITAEQVEDLVRASRRYDELVVAGFSFDGPAQEVIQEETNPRLKIHMAHIRPDVSPGMDGLLKDTPQSQLFTVFGQPEVEVGKAKKGEDGELQVELKGVDIYSPLTGEIKSTGASKVAAWFLDTDYDGRCFCVTQAFFPDQNAWEKIAKALGSAADAEAFAAYNGTTSVPFLPGKHNRIAVKVIDPRGNEVMAIRSLKEND
jgi:adenine-specific DNA-methyltransferase